MIEHHTSKPTVRTVTELEGSLSALLEHDRRKSTLSVLKSAGGAESFDDLVTDVAATEGFSFPPSDEHSEDVAVSLHHCHLPKLAESDLVNYDPDRDHVTLTTVGAECAEALDL